MEAYLTTVPAFGLSLTFIFFIIGLFSPKKILFWDKKPTRGKVFLYWVISTTVLIFIMVQVFNYYDSKKTPEERYQSALVSFDCKEYYTAISELEKIPAGSEYFDKAMALKLKADSLYQLEIEKQVEQEAKEKGIDTTMLEIVSVRLAKESVKQILKAPSTAEFPSENLRIWYLPDSSVIVKGAVDSQNSFGAMLRSDFYFKGKWYGDFEDSNNWEIIAVQLE